MKPLHCHQCPGFKWGQDFTEVSGTGANGVLLLGEASGMEEAAAGQPFVGPVGQWLQRMLSKASLDLNDFWVTNAVRCRPPYDDLKTPEAQAAIVHCGHYWREVVERLKPKAIVAIGGVPMKALLPSLEGKRAGQPATITERRGYVHWSDAAQTWVIPTFHPGFLVRGKQNLTNTVLSDIRHALKIAQEGFTFEEVTHLVDPPLLHAEVWMDDVLSRDMAATGGPPIAFDIETPMKFGEAEDELELGEAIEPIVRISFCVGFEAMSIPWEGGYIDVARRILASPNLKYVWNGAFDVTLLDLHGIPINGPVIDGMFAWHVLNSDLPKALAFVTPFYRPRRPAWKHLARTQLGYYNAEDSYATWHNTEGILVGLKKANLLDVFMRHEVELQERVLRPMTKVGVAVDLDVNRALDGELGAELKALDLQIQAIVPQELRTWTPKLGYVKPPKDLETAPPGTYGEREVMVPTQRCGLCPEWKPSKTHKLEHGQSYSIPVRHTRWVKLGPFKASLQQLKTYCHYRKIRPPSRMDKGVRKVSFNVQVVERLVRQYPTDPLWPLVLKQRRFMKWRSTYVVGLPIVDGRVHPIFTSNPSTLRLSCVHPNMQNIPRASEGEIPKRIRQQFRATGDNWFGSRDYKGIEAVLVGYFALKHAEQEEPGVRAACVEQARQYLRLCYLGVHAYVASHLLKRPADLNWSDDHLAEYFREIKKASPHIYDVAKRANHAGNYLGTARKLVLEYPDLFPSEAQASSTLGLIRDLFPVIKRWQTQTCIAAARSSYSRNPWGYLHRFYRVFEYSKDDKTGEWQRTLGEDAKRCVAFGPQSSAAAILREAMLRMKEEWVRSLRLTAHDELLGETSRATLEEMLEAYRQAMEAPNLPLPLDPIYGFGSHLSIKTEAKMGRNWGEMNEV